MPGRWFFSYAEKVSEETLVEFYERLSSSFSQYDILILALVRDADSQSFYSDIERYWNSIHDVTGERVLFAVAGQDAAARLGNSNVPLRFAYSTNIAFAPSRPEFNLSWLPRQEDIGKTNRDWENWWNFGQNIRNANTSQVNELRRFLNLAEADIPCLHLTLFSNPRRTVVLRLKDIPDFSIYTVCKDIMSRLQPVLDEITKPVQSQLQNCSEDRKVEDSATIANPNSLEKLLEEKFCALETLAQYTRTDRHWDYFISYPQKARELATGIFKKLDGLMRVFMDYFCLVAGQHWDWITPDIQAHSGGTIVLITPDTPSAHFQQSEIHLAIGLHRSQGHKIIPIYTDAGIQAPFGLQQIHGIVASRDAQSDIPSLLLDHLRRSGEPSFHSM